jgi:hypothetical protein
MESTQSAGKVTGIIGHYSHERLPSDLGLVGVVRASDTGFAQEAMTQVRRRLFQFATLIRRVQSCLTTENTAEQILGGSDSANQPDAPKR